MTLWNCWIVLRLLLIPMIGGISYKRRRWLIWGYGDTRLPSLRTRGPKCHTSRAEMSHKPGRNVTQAGPKCHTRAKMSHSHVIMLYSIVCYSEESSMHSMKQCPANFSCIIVTLWHHMALQMLVITGSTNGLAPLSTKPLPESILTYQKLRLMTYNTGGQFHVGNVQYSNS